MRAAASNNRRQHWFQRQLVQEQAPPQEHQQQHTQQPQPQQPQQEEDIELAHIFRENAGTRREDEECAAAIDTLVSVGLAASPARSPVAASIPQRREAGTHDNDVDALTLQAVLHASLYDYGGSRVGLTAEQIEATRTEGLPDEAANCTICREAVDVPETASCLRCGHWFHHGCVAVWLDENTTCPLCRAPAA